MSVNDHIGERERLDRGGRRGMTMVEILVAMAIVGLLGTLSYGVMMTAITTQQEASDVMRRHHAGRMTLERVKRELTMAFVSLHQAEDGRTQTIFEGENDRLLFVTAAYEPLRRNAHQSDQLEIEYYLTRVEDHGEMVGALARRVKYHIDDRPGKGGREEILVAGVDKLEFEYFDEHREDWRSEWDVVVDDAAEMRMRLKEVQAMRDQMADMQDDESTGVIGVIAGAEGEKQVDALALDLMDGLFLPSRVRMKLVLGWEDGVEFIMETQIEIPMVEPLWY